MAGVCELAPGSGMALVLLINAVKNTECTDGDAVLVKGLDADIDTGTLIFYLPVMNGFPVFNALGQWKTGEHILHVVAEQLLGRNLQNLRSLGTADEDAAIAIDTNNTGIQCLLEQVHQAFYLHRPVKHLFDAEGTFRQRGQVFLKFPLEQNGLIF